MRLARTPQETRGDLCAPVRHREVAGIGRALARFFALLLAALALNALPAAAQDPSAKSSGKGENKSAFAKPEGGMFGPRQKLDKSLPLYLQGDQLVYDTKGNRVIARGNVEIFYNDNILTADEVIYDQGASTLTAVGNVVLKEKNGNIVRAERYTLTDDFRDGFVQSLSVVARDESRITAEQAERREGNVTVFTNGKFTPCKSENGMPPLWCIRANKVIHDQTLATISYQDAQLEMWGVPILYLPYFEHPDPSVKRKSGFLPPEYGSSQDLGFMLEVPYFYNVAPNMNFTFHPAYLSKQGVLWQGDWEHKLADGVYSVKLAGIDQNGDDLPEGTTNRDQLDGWRGSLETKGKFSLSSWWKYGWDVTLESDDTFRRFYKLDSVLLTDRVNQAFVTGQSERSYLGATLYHFGGLLLNDTAQTESYVHPIIDYNYVFKDPVFGGELRWDSNVLSLTRDNTPLYLQNNTQSIVNQDLNRAVTQLKWRRMFTDTLGITYTPFGELRGDVYQINDYLDPITGQHIGDETIARGLATAGVTVSYPWVATAAGGSHVVEPIGQIITRQDSVNQQGLPDEDAKSLVFDDTNLFETDKFSGFDRLETGTRVNAGIQYTFQANSGGFVRVLAGESFHIKGVNPYAGPGLVSPNEPEFLADGSRNPNYQYVFSPTSGLETDNSDYVLGAYVAPNEYFRLISQSRFDQDNAELRREDLSGRVAYGPLLAQATYTYTAADPVRGLEVSQQDVTSTLGLRLTDRWSVLGSLRYDIDAHQRLMDAIQLRYLDECFMLSATYEETFITDPTRDITPDRTIMLRFEYKYLGGFAYKTNVLDHVYGDDQPPTP